MISSRPGNGAPVGGVERDRQRRGERHRAADTGPADQEHVARLVDAFALADTLRQEQREISGRRNTQASRSTITAVTTASASSASPKAIRLMYRGDDRVQLHAEEAGRPDR